MDEQRVHTDRIESAEVVLPCAELDATQRFFTERLAFRLETIFPADDPAVAVLAGHGLRLRLERGRSGAPGVLRLECIGLDSVADGLRELRAPNGTLVELVEARPAVERPPLNPAFALSYIDGAQWVKGRAGMRYRNLIPDSLGGRFGASHIVIPEAGEVADYVHFHRVHFQLIFCAAGWVKVVYEGQGPPFVLRAGDCVLQPPRIRHRVLECSDGLEVVELSSPARHETHVDHGLELPTATEYAEREFEGQRFTRHVAAGAEWGPGRIPGSEARDLGLSTATKGLVRACVVRFSGKEEPELATHPAELRFAYVLSGELFLHRATQATERLGKGDSCVVPADTPFALAAGAEGAEFLMVCAPA